MNQYIEIKMSNNDILKKLRVALKLRDDDIVKILGLVEFKISVSELGALFRNEDHPKYVECGDQILRNFLNGLIIHLRGPMPKKGEGAKPNANADNLADRPIMKKKSSDNFGKDKPKFRDASSSDRPPMKKPFDSDERRRTAPKSDNAQDRPQFKKSFDDKGGEKRPASPTRRPKFDGISWTTKTKSGKQKFKIDDRKEFKKKDENIESGVENERE